MGEELEVTEAVIIEEIPVVYNRVLITNENIEVLKHDYDVDIIWNPKSKKYNVIKDNINVLEFEKIIDIEKELINYLTVL